MAEFRLGRLKFNWRGEWTTSTAYVIDDVVQIGGNVYVCIINHTSAGTADGWYSTDFNIGSPRWQLMVPGVDSVGIFTSGTYYGPNDLVNYGGVLYRTLTPHVGTAFTNAYFQPYVEGFGNVAPFSTTTSYKLRDLVSFSGNVYVAATSGIAATTSTPNVAESDWDLLVTGISTVSISTYASGTTYNQGQLVTHGGNTYIAIQPTVLNVAPEGDDSGVGTSRNSWSLLVNGLRNSGAWSTSTNYYRNDVVTYTSSSYIAITTSSLGAQPDVSPSDWQQLAAGAGSATLTDRGDLLTRSASAPTRIGIGSTGMVLKSDGLDPVWNYFGQQKDNYYVGQNGSDSLGDGKTAETAWRTIGYALTNVPKHSCINVFAGTYAENLPMTVPIGVDVIGASQRQVFIQPATAGMGTTTMFFLSDNTLIKDVALRGLCGYAKTNANSNSVLGVDPGKVGCYFMLNPASPILTKSPYISDVTCFSGPSIHARVGFPGNTGSAIGAYIDGGVHAGYAATLGTPGSQSMVMDAYTQVLDEGIGIWVDNLGKAELVSIFTYFCNFGYVAMDGGIIRALNGNNSYGQFALAAFGNSPEETPDTGYVKGERLNLTPLSLSGGISIGQTITGATSGAVGYVLNDQTAADPPFIIFEYDYLGYGYTTFATSELVNIGAAETAITAATDTVEGINGFIVPLSGLSTEPRARGVIQFTNDQYSGLGSDGKTTYGFGITAISGYSGYGTDANAYTLSAVTDYVAGTFGVVGTYNTTTLALGANGTYVGVSVTTNSVNGSGAIFTVGVGATGYIDSMVVTTPGQDYAEGDMITVDGASIGGLAGAAATFNVFPRYGTAILRLAEEKTIQAATKQKITILYDYSQIRVTGHDFLDIGIGGTVASNYPLKPTTQPIEGNQITETAPARIFFVTSDQDGNFRVGNYFRVDQATGSATLNASAFNLSGLTELRLGSLGGQIGVAINEFSNDGTLSGNSDTAVPTEQAVKTYVDTAVVSARKFSWWVSR
jgi:hypothetical protein